MSGQGIPALLDRVDAALRPRGERLRLRIPYSNGPALALCYDKGRVLQRADGPDGIVLTVELPRHLAAAVEEYREPA
jgi:50S ribosomal subunit-associated GTPase HflX